MAQPIVTALLRDGRVTRGWLGVSIQDLTPELARSLGMRETSGVVVMEVDPQGPAAGADLRRGDRVVRLDDETIGSSRQLRNLVATRGAGVAVRLTRMREGQSAAVPITLRERPARTATSTITDADATEVRGMRLVTLDEGARRQFNVQDDVRAGAVVVSVTSDRPQGLGGDLRAGDVITEVNTQPVSTPAEVRQAIERSFLVTFLTVRRGAESLRVILPP
ncbi:MAG: PDZ domain-containing protein [Sandaracinaceae bacterium]|nr:PDZ domain-containing protein [Sandaracinaceae bacterium]